MTLYGFVKIKTAKKRAKWGYSLDISHYQHLSLNQRQVLEWENFVEIKSEGFRGPLIGGCWQKEAGGRLTERGGHMLCVGFGEHICLSVVGSETSRSWRPLTKSWALWTDCCRPMVGLFGLRVAGSFGSEFCCLISSVHLHIQSLSTNCTIVIYVKKYKVAHLH